MNKEFFEKRNTLYGQTIVKALESRRFEAYYCSTKQDALNKALALIPKEHTVGWGGSASIYEIGLVDKLISEGYKVFDRSRAETDEERTEIMRKALVADTFITGTNALTEDGMLLNVDGRGNRVAALTFGPKSVVVIAGINKVVRNAEDAVNRIKTTAAPINITRFPGKKTPCALTGKCGDCLSEDCICAHWVLTRLSQPAKRIKVILVGENLGF